MCTGSPLVNGSGTSANGRSGQPNTSAEKRASSTNPVDTNATVGRPRSSNAAISRISHDVHDPQSAVVPTSTSHSARISLQRLRRVAGQPALVAEVVLKRTPS